MHYAAELIKKQVHYEFEDTDIIKMLLNLKGDITLATRLVSGQVGVYVHFSCALQQTQETPLHYCARSGNADIMMEIVKHIGPAKTQYAVNRQDRVL